MPSDFYISSSPRKGFILFAHIIIVEMLCKSAEVTGEINPQIPDRISPVLNTDVKR